MYFSDAQCRSMIVRQSPTIAPSSSTEPLLTSNRKGKKKNHKNIQCTFIFHTFLSSCSTVCGYLETVHILNEPLSVIKKRPILRLDIFPNHQ